MLEAVGWIVLFLVTVRMCWMLFTSSRALQRQRLARTARSSTVSLETAGVATADAMTS